MIYKDSFWSDYQEIAFSFCGLRCRNLSYFVIGLNGEAAELTTAEANQIEAYKAKDNSYVSTIPSEIGDNLWYVSQITKFLDIDLDQLMVDATAKHFCISAEFDINAIAGRIAELYKKVLRTDKEPEDIVPGIKIQLKHYVQILLFKAQTNGIELEDAAIINLTKLSNRKRLNLIKGDGDTREHEASPTTQNQLRKNL